MSTDDAFFSVNGVSYAYADGTEVLSAIDWHIPAGAFHCLVGRSGCGKTTLLKLAAGLLQPTKGQVQIEGHMVHGPSPKVGFVFQTPALLEWLGGCWIWSASLIWLGAIPANCPVDSKAALPWLGHS